MFDDSKSGGRWKTQDARLTKSTDLTMMHFMEFTFQIVTVILLPSSNNVIVMLNRLKQQ
jgi:hypothetical protein